MVISNSKNSSDKQNVFVIWVKNKWLSGAPKINISLQQLLTKYFLANSLDQMGLDEVNVNQMTLDRLDIRKNGFRPNEFEPNGLNGFKWQYILSIL